MYHENDKKKKNMGQNIENEQKQKKNPCRQYANRLDSIDLFLKSFQF